MSAAGIEGPHAQQWLAPLETMRHVVKAVTQTVAEGSARDLTNIEETLRACGASHVSTMALNGGSHYTDAMFNDHPGVVVKVWFGNSHNWTFILQFRDNAGGGSAIKGGSCTLSSGSVDWYYLCLPNKEPAGLNTFAFAEEISHMMFREPEPKVEEVVDPRPHAQQWLAPLRRVFDAVGSVIQVIFNTRDLPAAQTVANIERILRANGAIEVSTDPVPSRISTTAVFNRNPGVVFTLVFDCTRHWRVTAEFNDGVGGSSAVYIKACTYSRVTAMPAGVIRWLLAPGAEKEPTGLNTTAFAEQIKELFNVGTKPKPPLKWRRIRGPGGSIM